MYVLANGTSIKWGPVVKINSPFQMEWKKSLAGVNSTHLCFITFLLKVGVVNFSPYCPTTEPDNLVTTKIYTSKITSVLCPEDILSSEVRGSNQVYKRCVILWAMKLCLLFAVCTCKLMSSQIWWLLSNIYIFRFIAIPSIERGLVWPCPDRGFGNRFHCHWTHWQETAQEYRYWQICCSYIQKLPDK